MTVTPVGEGPQLRLLALFGRSVEATGGAGLVETPTETSNHIVTTVFSQPSKAACPLAKTGVGAGPEGKDTGTGGKVVLSINKY